MDETCGRRVSQEEGEDGEDDVKLMNQSSRQHTCWPPEQGDAAASVCNLQVGTLSKRLSVPKKNPMTRWRTLGAVRTRSSSHSPCLVAQQGGRRYRSNLIMGHCFWSVSCPSLNLLPTGDTDNPNATASSVEVGPSEQSAPPADLDNALNFTGSFGLPRMPVGAVGSDSSVTDSITSTDHSCDEDCDISLERQYDHTSLERQDGSVSPEREDGVVSLERQDGAMSPERQDGAMLQDKQDGVMSLKRQDGDMSLEGQDGAVSLERQDGAMSTKSQDCAISPERQDVAMSTESQVGAMSLERQDSAMSPLRQSGAMLLERQDSAVSPERQDGAMSLERQDSAVSPERQDGDMSLERQDSATSLEIQCGAVSLERQQSNTNGGMHLSNDVSADVLDLQGNNMTTTGHLFSVAKILFRGDRMEGTKEHSMGENNPLLQSSPEEAPAGAAGSGGQLAGEPAHYPYEQSIEDLARRDEESSGRQTAMLHLPLVNCGDVAELLIHEVMPSKACNSLDTVNRTGGVLCKDDSELVGSPSGNDLDSVSHTFVAHDPMTPAADDGDKLDDVRSTHYNGNAVDQLSSLAQILSDPSCETKAFGRKTFLKFQFD